jgi:hypothetical protein
MQDSRYISLPQAARRARCAQAELLRAIYRHELPARLHFHRWWLRPADVATWRQARRERGRAA